MKKSLLAVLTFSFSLLSFNIFAQYNPATPNNGFEYWTHFAAGGGYDDPDSGWSCLNPTTEGIGVITCFKDSLTHAHSGMYAAHLLTGEYVAFSIIIPGALTTGTFNTINYSVNGGIPYTQRPDSMIGWYEYTSVSGDNGDCEFYLFGATHADTIGQAFFRTPTSNVSTYTRFSLPIKYSSSNTPDTSLWVFSSSNTQASAQVGSQLWVDDLGLVFNSHTGINTFTNSDNIKVGPNPSTGFVSIENNTDLKNLNFYLLEVTGREISTKKMTGGVNNLQLSELPQGVYIYSIKDEQNTVIKNGKIVIQK